MAKLSANKQGAEWQAAAYQAYVEHARKHKFFTTEDVRFNAKHVPHPTDPRAWGYIAKIAQKNGIMIAVDLVRPKSKTVHGRHCTLWQSTLLS